MRARPVLRAIKHAPRPVADRFWRRVDRRGPDECWPWTGAKTQFGHGNIRIGHATFVCSRVAYALATGDEPGNLLVCHSCDNPSCCNPAHLWLGTDDDNHRDMMAKGRWRGNGVKGERNVQCRLTEAQARVAKFSKIPGVVLAARFGVARSTISEIRQGRNWAWLEPEQAAA